MLGGIQPLCSLGVQAGSGSGAAARGSAALTREPPGASPHAVNPDSLLRRAWQAPLVGGAGRARLLLLRLGAPTDWDVSCFQVSLFEKQKQRVGGVHDVHTETPVH